MCRGRGSLSEYAVLACERLRHIAGLFSYTDVGRPQADAPQPAR